MDRTSNTRSIRAALQRDRRAEFLEALRRCASVRKAIRELGVSKSTFYRVVGDVDTRRLTDNRSCNVLVVDDKYYKRFEIQDSLLEHGVVSELASGGREALQMAERGDYTCVVTDQVMPEMDGLELSERLLERDRRMPVILLTSHATVPLTRQAFKRGLSDVIEYQSVDWRSLAGQISELSKGYLDEKGGDPSRTSSRG